MSLIGLVLNYLYALQSTSSLQQNHTYLNQIDYFIT